MRDLLLGIIIPTGLVLGLFSAPASIINLNWICFQRPYDFSWGVWNALPIFQISLFIAIVSNVFKGQFRFKVTLLLSIYLLILSALTLSTILAYSPSTAWTMYNWFLPPMWITPIVIFSTIHDLNLLKWVIWVSAGGIGFNGFKVGVSLTASGGGHLTEQISGFVGDNNVFGLVLCLVVAVILGLRRTLPDKLILKTIYYIFILFIILCIVYTKSRGALLSICMVFFLASIISRRPFRSLTLLFSIFYVGYVLIPPEYFDRLNTLDNIKGDVSAMGRIENWKLAWDEAVRHPFFGIGPGNHIIYNKSIQADVQVRVAHSVYFQVLGELGFVGFFFYMWFVLLGLWTFFKTWRIMAIITRNYPEFLWVRDLSFWMLAGYIGYLFGSSLLDMFYIEYPWYFVFYGSMLAPLVKKKIEFSRKI